MQTLFYFWKTPNISTGSSFSFLFSSKRRNMIGIRLWIFPTTDNQSLLVFVGENKDLSRE